MRKFYTAEAVTEGHPDKEGKGISAIWTCGLWRLWGNDDQTGCSIRRKGRCLCLLDSYGAGFSAVQAAVEAAKGKTGHS